MTGKALMEEVDRFVGAMREMRRHTDTLERAVQGSERHFLELMRAVEIDVAGAEALAKKFDDAAREACILSAHFCSFKLTLQKRICDMRALAAEGGDVAAGDAGGGGAGDGDRGGEA